MRKRSRKTVAAAIILSFFALAIFIIWMGNAQVVTPAAAMLMLVAEVGLYVGVGILVGVYRLVMRMQ